MATSEPTAQELRAAASWLHIIPDEEMADRVRACHKVARWLISQASRSSQRSSKKPIKEKSSVIV